MTKRERVEAVYALERPDRIPFVPAVYEHKARLAGVTPSALCRDAELLARALEREVAIYDPDVLTVGVDVYNVEAEALGCRVRFFDDSPDVPAIVEPALREPGDLDRLAVPDPETAGRMPVFLAAAREAVRRFGDHMFVRGAVSGPYSMAAELVGAERFVMATVEEPAFARRLLEFTARVAAAYGAAFVRRGADPILFDSRATPQLASPRVFREMLLPVYRDILIPQLKRAGARFIPLIIGGNTNSIVDAQIATGVTQLLCDRPASLARFREACRPARVAFRANVDARLVHSGPPEAVRAQADEILAECRDHPGFLLGCGVVAFDTPPENVLAIREALVAPAVSPALME